MLQIYKELKELLANHQETHLRLFVINLCISNITKS